MSLVCKMWHQTVIRIVWEDFCIRDRMALFDVSQRMPVLLLGIGNGSTNTACFVFNQSLKSNLSCQPCLSTEFQFHWQGHLHQRKRMLIVQAGVESQELGGAMVPATAGVRQTIGAQLAALGVMRLPRHGMCQQNLQVLGEVSVAHGNHETWSACLWSSFNWRRTSRGLI